MENIIKGATPFSVPTSDFAISPSTVEYTLEYSVDGTTWTPWKESTPAGENLMVVGGVKTMLYRLNGNTENLILKYA